MHIRKLAFALPAVLALVAGQTTLAHAQFSITPTFDSTWINGGTVKNADGTTTTYAGDANYAADEASIVSFYAANYGGITNNVAITVVISDVNFGLGTTASASGKIDYNTYVSGLTTSKASSDDSAGSSAFLNFIPSSNPTSLTDTRVSVTTAQLRLLGINQAGVVGDDLDPTITGSFDAHIELNVGVSQADGYNIAAVNGHETDEVMGLGSGLNAVNQNPSRAITNITGEDLFRFSSGARSFTTTVPTAGVYYSDDNGATISEYFNGDAGADYQDWASNRESYDFAPAVQDAFSTPNSTSNLALGSAEYKALNDVGYNFAFTGAASAPEPSSLLLLLPGALTLSGMILRRRKSAIKGA